MIFSNFSHNKVLLGITLIIGFTVFGPIMDSFAKLASNSLPIGEIVFSRFFVQILSLFPLVVILKLSYLPNYKELILHFIRALLIITATSLFFSAIKFMPIADALAIFLVNPFLMILLSRLFLKEKISKSRIFACVFGFFGALLIIKPSYSLFGVVCLFPLGTAFSYSIYMILTRHMTKVIHPIPMQFFTGLAAVFIMCTLLFIFHDKSFKPLTIVWPDFVNFLFLIGVGITATISHIFVVYGLRLIPASTAAPILYFEIVVAALLGYFIFSDFPDLIALTGIIIIVFAGLYISIYENFFSKETIHHYV